MSADCGQRQERLLPWLKLFMRAFRATHCLVAVGTSPQVSEASRNRSALRNSIHSPWHHLLSQPALKLLLCIVKLTLIPFRILGSPTRRKPPLAPTLHRIERKKLLGMLLAIAATAAFGRQPFLQQGNTDCQNGANGQFSTLQTDGKRLTAPDAQRQNWP